VDVFKVEKPVDTISKVVFKPMAETTIGSVLMFIYNITLRNHVAANASNRAFRSFSSSVITACVGTGGRS
jgi:hypothetical protein